jgi:hypothetical protein
VVQTGDLNVLTGLFEGIGEAVVLGWDSRSLLSTSPGSISDPDNCRKLITVETGLEVASTSVISQVRSIVNTLESRSLIANAGFEGATRVFSKTSTLFR